jgi:hypothetical protein
LIYTNAVIRSEAARAPAGCGIDIGTRFSATAQTHYQQLEFASYDLENGVRLSA